MKKAPPWGARLISDTGSQTSSPSVEAKNIA